MQEEHLVGDLRYSIVEGARAVPLAFSSGPGSVRGGLLGPDLPSYAVQWREWDDGERVTTTRLRHQDPTGYLYSPPTRTLDGTTAYLGPLHRHFGHFATESITRAWIADVRPLAWDRLIFVPETGTEERRKDFSLSSLPAWQKDALEYLGVADCEFVTEPVRFERLVIPEPGAILFGANHSTLMRASLSSRAASLRDERQTPRKVFYSRDAGLQSVLGESYIGEFLAQFGYATVLPERLSFIDQMAIAKNASHVIGVQGSAFHSFNFLGAARARALVIKRQSARVTRGFLRSLMPYVESVALIEGERLITSHSSGVQAAVDVEALLRGIASFDPAIDTGLFSWDRFYSRVIDDLVGDSENRI
jgi:capsular polysaccharide biosynthesis protein